MLYPDEIEFLERRGMIPIRNKQIHNIVELEKKKQAKPQKSKKIKEFNIKGAMDIIKTVISKKPQCHEVLNCIAMQEDTLWGQNMVEYGRRGGYATSIKINLPEVNYPPCCINVQLANSISEKIEIESSPEGGERANLGKVKADFIPIEEMPVFPAFEPSDKDVQINLENFIAILEKTTLFIGNKDEMRSILQGIALVDKNKIVSTDGRRIVEYEFYHGIEQSVFNPKEIIRILKKINLYHSIIYLQSQEGLLFFYTLDQIITVCITTLEGEYPNYSDSVFCNKKEYLDQLHQVSVNREEFSSAIKKAMIMAKEEINPGMIQLIFHNGGKLLVHSKTADLGEVNIEVNAVYDLCDLFRIAFNGKYLLDILSLEKGDVFDFYLKDSISLIFVKGMNIRGALMPIRLKEEIYS